MDIPFDTFSEKGLTILHGKEGGRKFIRLRAVVFLSWDPTREWRYSREWREWREWRYLCEGRECCYLRSRPLRFASGEEREYSQSRRFSLWISRMSAIFLQWTYDYEPLLQFRVSTPLCNTLQYDPIQWRNTTQCNAMSFNAMLFISYSYWGLQSFLQDLFLVENKMNKLLV